MKSSDALVSVIDDESSVRTAIGRLLEAEGYCFATFAKARDFLAQPRRQGPGCVIVDLNLPDLNGLGLQQTLRETGHEEALVFITGGATVLSCASALKGGAIDYLTKPLRDDDLLIAIERAIEYSREQTVKRSLQKAARVRLATLTPREFDVLQLIITGLLNKQMGAKLGTTEGTIKVHRGRVMQKMGVTSAVELLVIAQRAGVGSK